MIPIQSWPYEKKPLIVFWETTRACKLACKHCRAEAIENPLPGELSYNEGLKLIDDITSFGRPYPILILTGGDVLMRKDLWDITSYSLQKGIRTALAPSVTPLLNNKTIRKIADIGIKSVSISLDSPFPQIHDEIRGVNGTFEKTIKVIDEFQDYGVNVQINTVVMKTTVEGLPYMVSLLRKKGITVWEVFYFIPVGRGVAEENLSPREWEDVSWFLYHASKYGIKIRTTEGPIFRRVTLMAHFIEKNGGRIEDVFSPTQLYHRLKNKMEELLGKPDTEPMAHTTGTRDGKGIVFVAYNGEVYPSGFLPLSAGNIKTMTLKQVYQKSNLFVRLRKAKYKGKCGICEFKEICGGSRARAYAMTNDPFETDPACNYTPGEYKRLSSYLKIDEGYAI